MHYGKIHDDISKSDTETADTNTIRYIEIEPIYRTSTIDRNITNEERTLAYYGLWARALSYYYRLSQQLFAW